MLVELPEGLYLCSEASSDGFETGFLIRLVSNFFSFPGGQETRPRRHIKPSPRNLKIPSGPEQQLHPRRGIKPEGNQKHSNGFSLVFERFCRT